MKNNNNTNSAVASTEYICEIDTGYKKSIFGETTHGYRCSLEMDKAIEYLYSPLHNKLNELAKTHPNDHRLMSALRDFPERQLNYTGPMLELVDYLKQGESITTGTLEESIPDLVSTVADGAERFVEYIRDIKDLIAEYDEAFIAEFDKANDTEDDEAYEF